MISLNKLILVSYFIFLITQIKGQENSVLIFSDTIQSTLFSKINQKETTQRKYYARVSYVDKANVKINLSYYDSLNTYFALTKLVNSSNSKIQIKTFEIPVLHEVDFLFSNYVKRYNEEGFLIEEHYPQAGFYIVFNQFDDNIIIEEGFDRW